MLYFQITNQVEAAGGMAIAWIECRGCSGGGGRLLDMHGAGVVSCPCGTTVILGSDFSRATGRAEATTGRAGRRVWTCRPDSMPS